MRRFAFAVIASVVLGLEGGDIEALFADFEIWTRALFSVPIALPGSPFARALQARARRSWPGCRRRSTAWPGRWRRGR